MEELREYKRQEVTQEFNVDLFSEFVSWIGRGEKTTRSYLTNLRQFVAWLRYVDVKNPVRSDVFLYREWLTTEHDAIQLDPSAAAGWSYRTDSTGQQIRVKCKPNTVAQYLRIVRQFFAWTASAGLYPDIANNIHAPKVNTETHKKDFLTAEDVLQVENSIKTRSEERQTAAGAAAKDKAGRISRSTEQGKRLYAMYLLAVNAGLRTVEISRANIKDLETKGGQTWLYVWGKGHAEADQKKALAPEVVEAIRDYLRIRSDKPTGSSPLFVSTGNRSGGKRIATTTISTMLKRAMQEAGYNSERLTAHSLRHSAAQAALKASNNNIYATQKYMRHQNPQTTEIYLHEDEQTEQAGRALAVDVYNLYHGILCAGSVERLNSVICRLSSDQIEHLTAIASVMA